MMNTFSLFPINTAHPPLVGKTARTCTSITVLFIAQRYLRENEKQAAQTVDAHMRLKAAVHMGETKILLSRGLNVRRAD